jgi:RecB family exonuclease
MVKKLRSENNFLSIPYSADFISTLANHINDNDYDVVILPTLRACRALKAMVSKSLQVITYSAISDSYFKKCSNEALKFAAYEVENEFISADDLYEFLVQYFTYCEDLESLKNINVKLYGLLKKTIEIINSKGFEVPQIANNKAVDVVVENWKHKKILAAVPHTSSKYILRYIKHLSESGQTLVLHEEDRVGDIRASKKYIEFKNEYEEAEFITSRVIRTHNLEVNKRIGIISSNSIKNRIITEKLRANGIEINSALESALLDSPTIKMFIQLLSIHIEPSVKNILRILKDSAFKLYSEDTLKFEKDFLRKGKLERSIKECIPEEFSRDIENLTTFRNVSELFNSHIQTFEKYFEILDTQAFQKLKSLFSENSFKMRVDIVGYRDILVQLIRGFKYREETDNKGSIEITSLIESNLIKYDVIFFTEFTEENYSGIRKAKRYLSKDQEKLLGFPDPSFDEAKAKALFFSQFSSNEVVITYPVTVSGRQSTRSNILELIRKNLTFTPNPLNLKGRKTKIERPIIKCDEVRSQLSVTAIEKLMQDPYAFYAYYFLNLKPLEKLDLAFSNREFGNVVHKILSTIDFSSSEEIFIKAFRAEFQKQTQHYGIDKHDVIWLRRAHKIAKEIYLFNSQRSHTTKKVYREIGGAVQFGNIKIIGKADRIDIKKDGSCDIIDYKTGAVPTALEIQRGEKPQLGIEAVILENNGFEFSESRLDQLIYIDLKCKEDTETINDRKIDLQLFKEGLAQLIEKFFVKEKLFFANFQSDESPFISEFSKLSREQEWN